MHERNFVSDRKSTEQLKAYLLMSSTFFCPNVSFQRYLHKKEALLTFLGLTSSSSPERYLLLNERIWFGTEKETVQMPQESSLRPKKMYYLKMASSVFTIRNHYKGLCGGFFLFILAGGLEMKAVSCVGET